MQKLHNFFTLRRGKNETNVNDINSAPLFDTLVPDIQTLIFCHLETNDLLSFARISKKWSSYDNIWKVRFYFSITHKALCIRENLIELKSEKHSSWKDFYSETYALFRYNTIDELKFRSFYKILQDCEKLPTSAK